jgi:hypothetical protein
MASDGLNALAKVRYRIFGRIFARIFAHLFYATLTRIFACLLRVFFGIRGRTDIG